jgi:LysM repeat protein
MNIESSSDRAKSKRSLLMKIGSAVIAIHVAVLCVFALTQGCVTTESQGSGRGAGARHKGPWKHEHKAVEPSTMMQTGQDPYQAYGQGADDSALYAPVIIETQSSTPEPYVGSSTPTETYIVRKGDMISQLAVDFDTTTAELVRLNNLSNPDVLYVGQELRVPAGRGGASKSSTSSSSAPSVKKGGTYTIQKGDTLSGIAVAAGVSINELRSLNNINGDMIRAGDTIDIPAGGNVPTDTQKVTGTKTADPVEPAPAAAEPAPAPMAAVGTDPEVGSIESVDMIQEVVFYPGDSLDDIAQKYGVGKAEIMRLNNITDETQIQNGQRLRIPIAE